MSAQKWFGLGILLASSAAMAAAVPNARTMSECLLDVDAATAQAKKLPKVTEKDLSNDDKEEYEITYDSTMVRPFGLKTRAFYYATYSDEAGSDIMLQSELIDGYVKAKAAFLKANGATSCWQEETNPNNRACKLQPAAGTNMPTRTVRETDGQVDVLCTYYL